MRSCSKTTPRRILLVVDWPERGRWLWDYLPENDTHVQVVSMVHPPDRFPGWGKFLGYYPAYARHGVRAALQCKGAQVVVAWEAKNGVPIALCRRLTGMPRSPLVILNFSPRGPIARMSPLVSWALKAADCITCISRADIQIMQQRYHVPAEKLALLPSPGSAFPDSLRSQLTTPLAEPYILASGRSYRDYDTFLKAVSSLTIRVEILARAFNLPRIQIPNHVHVRDLLPQHEFQALLAGARVVVVPLIPVPHSAGEGHVVEIMGAGRPMVVTDNPSIRDYVTHGYNGLLVPAGDPIAMRNAICYFLDNPAEAERMARNGRSDYEAKYAFPRWASLADALICSITRG